MRQYEENGYLITEYDNGTIIKQAISTPTQQEPAPIDQQESQLDRIENSLDLLLLKQEGIL